MQALDFNALISIYLTAFCTAMSVLLILLDRRAGKKAKARDNRRD